MKIEVHYNFVGMSENYIYHNVAIDHPFDIEKRVLNVIDLNSNKIKTIEDLICFIKNDTDLKHRIGEFVDICISMDKALIYYKNSYLKLTTDKTLLEICDDLETDEIVIEFFIIPGGASREYRGYLFVVHSDEDVHKFSVPHVHVKKDGFSPRYRLDTFEMIEGDSCDRQYKRDRKLIQDFLRKNKEWFIEKWKLALKGYQTLPLNEDGLMELEEKR